MLLFLSGRLFYIRGRSVFLRAQEVFPFIGFPQKINLLSAYVIHWLRQGHVCIFKEFMPRANKILLILEDNVCKARPRERKKLQSAGKSLRQAAPKVMSCKRCKTRDRLHPSAVNHAASEILGLIFLIFPPNRRNRFAISHY